MLELTYLRIRHYDEPLRAWLGVEDCCMFVSLKIAVSLGEIWANYVHMGGTTYKHYARDGTGYLFAVEPVSISDRIVCRGGEQASALIPKKLKDVQVAKSALLRIMYPAHRPAK